MLKIKSMSRERKSTFYAPNAKETTGIVIGSVAGLFLVFILFWWLRRKPKMRYVTAPPLIPRGQEFATVV